MRRAIRWSLAATLLLTAVALWPRQEIAVVGAMRTSAARAMAADDNANRTPLPPLPASLEPWSVEPARRDPFAPADATAPAPAPVPTQVEPPPLSAPLAAVAVAPSLNYRYFGTMTAPDGRRLTLLARGDVVVPVAVGTRLDEGHVVESISASSVRLVHPELGTLVDVTVPPAPSAP